MTTIPPVIRASGRILTGITGKAKIRAKLTELLTKIHGNHELKFGFEGRIHQQNYIQTNAPLGIFSFNALAVRNVRYPISRNAAATAWPAS